MTDTTDAIVEVMRDAIRDVKGGLNYSYEDFCADAARAALAAALPVLREVAAKCADKRTEDRFADFGVTEPDTNSSFYPGRCADIYYQLDEEDECVAGDIRARFAAMAKEINP